MLFPPVSYLVWIRIPFFLVAGEFDMSNSFTNFLGLPASFMYEVLIYPVVQQRSWEFQRELHCFYWTRMLIAIFSKTWNILYHTVLRTAGNWWSIRDVRLKQHWLYGDAVATRGANGMFCCIHTISLAILLLHLAQCDTEVDVWQQRYIPVSVLSVSHTVAGTNSRRPWGYDDALSFSSSSPLLQHSPLRAVFVCFFLISRAMVLGYLLRDRGSRNSIVSALTL